MNFQDVILALQKYWAEKGCVLSQPYDLEVGAGTFHPATLLKSLGPEPWKVAYAQPCRRPTDGRYGDNPMRLQHYYQFQVILKPSPSDVQQLYLDSLMRAIPGGAPPRRLYLPIGTPAERARQLRAEGWSTVQGLEPAAELEAEARRLTCDHILRDGAPAAL